MKPSSRARTFRRFIPALLLSAISAVSLAQSPAFLVVQRVPRDDQGNFVISDLGVQLVTQMRETFVLEAMEWSLGDPNFRDAVFNGQIPGNIEAPTDAQIADAARALKAPFYAVITLQPRNASLNTVIQVYRTGQRRPAWSKLMETGVQLEGSNDRRQSETTIVRSWIVELQQGVLKPYVRPPEVRPTPLDQGVPIAPDTTERPAVEEDPTTILQRIRTLVQGRQILEALQALYSEIDRQPTSLPLRLELIQLLAAEGRAEELVEECGRSLLVFPGNEAIRLQRIGGLLQLGRLEAASEEINEALARQPENPQVLELRGTMFLFRGNLQPARETFLTLLKQAENPSRTPQALLALTVGLEGDTAEAQRLMSTLEVGPAGLDAATYHRLWMGANFAVERAGTELREVLRLGRLQPGNSGLVERARRAFKNAEGMAIVLDACRPPQVHLTSHNERVLAQKLLTQATAEILQFVRSGNPDLGDEATLSLAIALRKITEAQVSYQQER